MDEIIEDPKETVSGLVYSEFSRKKHIIKPFKIPSDWILIAIAPNGEQYMCEEIGGKIIEELKEIVKEWRAKSKRRMDRYEQYEGTYWWGTASAIDDCAETLEELVSKYDVK